MTLILFILIIGILVLVHELGHFIAAKKAGVRVEEFGFGFPPRIFGKKIGETLYSINLIPFGGFVKLFGEEYAEMQSKSKTADQSKAFVYKKPIIKAVIIVGGVLMNFLLAIILYYVTFSVNNFKSEPLPLIKEYHFRFGNQENKVAIGAVAEGSPASKTQIESGDLIYRAGVENKQSKLVWNDIHKPEQFIELVKNSQDKTIYLDIENSINGEKKTITVVPLYDNKLKRAIIGINLVDAAVISYDSIPERLLSGFLHSYNVTAYNIEGIRFLFSQSAKSKSLEPVAEGSAGPIGIFRIIDEMVKSSGKKLLINLLNLLALLSLSLGVINIIPFPALDGGRFAMILYEWITGKRINTKVEKYLIVGGFILLMALAVLVTINDIMKINR